MLLSIIDVDDHTDELLKIILPKGCLIAIFRSVMSRMAVIEIALGQIPLGNEISILPNGYREYLPLFASCHCHGQLSLNDGIFGPETCRFEKISNIHDFTSSVFRSRSTSSRRKR